MCSILQWDCTSAAFVYTHVPLMPTSTEPIIHLLFLSILPLLAGTRTAMAVQRRAAATSAMNICVHQCTWYVDGRHWKEPMLAYIAHLVRKIADPLYLFIYYGEWKGDWVAIGLLYSYLSFYVSMLNNRALIIHARARRISRHRCTDEYGVVSACVGSAMNEHDSGFAMRPIWPYQKI